MVAMGVFYLTVTSNNQMSLSALPAHPFLCTCGVRHSRGTPRGLSITRMGIWDLVVGEGFRRGQDARRATPLTCTQRGHSSPGVSLWGLWEGTTKAPAHLSG